MPSVSRQQQKLMFATAGGAKTGVSKKVAKDFVAADKARGKKKLPKRKARAKKASNPIAISDYPREEREHRSVTMRKIKNGYLTEHSRSGGEGPYESETLYHPKKPKIEMTVGDTKLRISGKRLKRLEKMPI